MKRLLKNYPLWIILSALCLISSCRIAKDDKLPPVELSFAYRNVALMDTTSIATIPWQIFFADSALIDLLDVALMYNNDLQVAVKNIEAAGAVLHQRKLGNIPSIDLQAGAIGNRPSDNSLNGFTLSQFLGQKHIADYTLGVALSWEADVWGKIRSQEQAALTWLLHTEASWRAVQTRIVNDIAKGYYNLLMLDAQLAIAQHNVSLNDSTLAIAHLQYQAGQVTSLAVEQVEAQKLAAGLLVPDFEQQIIIQENAISILSGVMPAKIKRNATWRTARFASALPTGLPAALLERRPDIKQAEYVLARANAEVSYSKASLYPSFTITAQGGLNAFKSSNWFDIPASLFGAVAGGITQPLLNKRKLHTDYELSKIEREKAVIQFRQTVLVAVGEVSDALVKLEKLKQRYTLADLRTAQLKQATKNAQLLFINGRTDYLAVITAQRDVLQSELELSGIQKAQLDAVVDLYRSVGGGWK